jgi:phospholipid/cholesterol/gamma-HCH transport system substrate-binding protein
MKNSSSIKLKTGVFVIVGVAVILGALFLIGRQQKMFSKSFDAYANFKNVSGLQVGNYVRFAGINVGIVNNIVIKNDTTVKVNFSLESRMKPFLKSDAIASISSDGLMGDKLVQIAPGSDSAELFKEGSGLRTLNPVEVDKIMAKVTQIADNAATVTEGLAQIVDKVNNGHGSIAMLLRNDTLARRLENTVASARETVGTIKTSASKFNDNMDAAKHNFLLRGFFKKKEKQRLKDSTNNQKQEDSKKQEDPKNKQADSKNKPEEQKK